MIKLRDYQKNIIKELRDKIKNYGYRSQVVVAPTGSGKTIIFAHLAQSSANIGKRVLVLVHRREILEQTLEKLLSFGVHAGQVAAGRPMTDNLVTVAMITTLVNRLESIPEPDLIIIDEFHHCVSKTWTKVLNHYKDAIKIGFTATPERLDGAGLIKHADVMINGPSVKWLVKHGFLSYPKVYTGDAAIENRVKLKITRGDYDREQQTQVMTKRYIVGDVIEHYKKHLNGLPAVAFCSSIDHCNVMEDAFNAAGFRAKTVKGDMTREDRTDAIQGLGNGKYSVLCSYDVISEGVDIPVISGAILLRRTKSLSVYLQQVGRALRPYPGKTHAVILDHAGNFHEHGHPLDNREWSLYSKKRSERKNMKLPELSVCDKCGGVWPASVKICPDCGYNIKEAQDRKKGIKPPEEIAGILHQVVSADENEIQELVNKAMAIQRLNGDDRRRKMLSNLYQYGNTDKTRGLAMAIGYKKNWTDTVWRRIKHEQKRV